MMTSQAFLFAGIAVGLSVAVPVGPMGLLCIQRTLSGGMRVGLSTGLGAATVNVLYGALVILGLHELAPLVAGGARVLSFAGGVFLLWSAARTLRRRRLGAAPAPATLSPIAAYGTAVAFNATNPMSPMLLIALLTPVLHASAPSLAGTALLLLGMFAAAMAWWTCLSGGVTVLRSRLSPRVLGGVNQMAAAVLTFYGALALARSAGM